MASQALIAPKTAGRRRALAGSVASLAPDLPEVTEVFYRTGERRRQYDHDMIGNDAGVIGMDGLVLVTPLDAANRCPKADGLVELLAALAVIGCVPWITRWGASWTQPKRRRPQLHEETPWVSSP
jgi:hypothetical protein